MLSLMPAIPVVSIPPFYMAICPDATHDGVRLIDFL
jgi:hypothetical protein